MQEQFLTYQIILGFSILIGLFCFIRILIGRLSREGETLLIMGFIFLGIIPLLISIGLFFNMDYSLKNTYTFHPIETSLMYDDKEVIIKYTDEKLNREIKITDHVNYLRVLDSCYYIEKITFYNFFGWSEDSTYNLITFDKEKSINGPISIDL